MFEQMVRCRLLVLWIVRIIRSAQVSHILYDSLSFGPLGWRMYANHWLHCPIAAVSFSLDFIGSAKYRSMFHSVYYVTYIITFWCPSIIPCILMPGNNRVKINFSHGILLLALSTPLGVCLLVCVCACVWSMCVEGNSRMREIQILWNICMLWRFAHQNFTATNDYQYTRQSVYNQHILRREGLVVR